MSKLRVHCFAISLDGYGAGPNQSRDNPLGVGGMGLHEWQLATPTFKKLHASFLDAGDSSGAAGVDDGFVSRGFENVGAWIIGRNMFGVERGPWRDESWKGWWGSNPPYHVPVYILTHYVRPSIEMEGGTVFHFVDSGIESALQKAKASAGGKDVRLGGGVATVRSYLQAGLVDEMHYAVSPVFLGSGEHLLHGMNLPALGYRCAELVPSDKVSHYIIRKS